MRNLVSNALKFSKSGGSIAVTVDAVTTESILIIRVVDQGPGISQVGASSSSGLVFVYLFILEICTCQCTYS